MMPEALLVVLGAVLAMAGSALQSRFQTGLLARQFEEQRRLDAEDHARRQVVVENERLRPRIDAQLEFGRRVALAMGRYKATVPAGLSHVEAKEYLDRACTYASLDRTQQPPYPDFLRKTEIDDQELADLIDEHERLVLDFDTLLNSDVLRAETPDFVRVGRVDTLARSIENRYRVLQREGLPI
jgi:hypothetical protein